MSSRGGAVCLAAALGFAGCSTGPDSSAAGETSVSSTQTLASTVASTVATTAAAIDLDGTIRRIASDWYGTTDIGGAVAVVGTPDGAVHVAAVGHAAPGIPASRDDVMRTGSITKSFTAALAVRLARRGLIELDAPVTDVLPELALAPEVTVRTLLDHTSGITDPDANELVARFRADPAHRFSTEELIGFAQLPTTGPVGEFRYANANYHLVGALIERVTGRDFADVLRSEILDVAGLEHTYLVGSEPVPEPVVPGNADLDGDGTEDSLADVPYLAVDSYGWAAGAIATTPADLVAVARAVFDGTLLDDEGVAELTDRTHDGQRPLGLVQVDAATWAHNGGAPGYRAAYLHHADRGVTTALFTNCPSCAAGDPDLWEPIGELLDAATARRAPAA
jgi:D-alanyl-D-alanine carboxypeptidase